ncbi:hypothetical protein HZZ00_36255 [Streptomyces sp. NEAU-sy36]|nr:hypothetical protein HZZ00_36255 [Streptomyces sp. NEAU-sy36]
MRIFGLTKEAYSEIFELQLRCCAICQTPDPGPKDWHIDHDHQCCPRPRSCGACVRGLLCASCNSSGLGWYESLPEKLKTYDVLNEYLRNPPAYRVVRKPGYRGRIDL